MFCKPMHLNFTGTGQSITHDASWYTHNAIDCWSSLHQLLIPPDQQSTVLIIDHLTVDCWSSITSLLTIDPLTVDCWSAPQDQKSTDLQYLLICAQIFDFKVCSSYIYIVFETNIGNYNNFDYMELCLYRTFFWLRNDRNGWSDVQTPTPLLPQIFF